ncbi:STT3 domain-containing protein [Methanobrevibacter sp.]|uniref:STT3 domain-containing protein n=1 Tax=Methanobrevibacter sp. TaxID=66852 RepID=UPI0025E44B34|nr:STT3 domain-containing protein [Methanobrevibacter sp.]MBQ2832818.1 peptide transporter [Methanobrevibacter sp.]
MKRETMMTVAKSVVIILILLAVVFALKAPAADLNIFTDEARGEYVDSSGLPYFSEMDSYYNLRLTEDYVDHGYVGDEKINGSEWDMHRYAPTGDEINYELGIVYVTTFFHDVANNFFGGDYSVKEIAFWTGAIISSLAVIPAFIFARRLTNNYGAIVATLLIVLAPNYFAHTFPGFFDTDMFYYIFSLFFIFFFIESIRAKNILYKVLFAILSIISIGLFSQSWTGYIFYVGLMGIFSVVYLIACYIFNVGDDNQEEYPNKLQWFIHQKHLLSIIILGVIGFVGIAFFKGFDGAIGIFSELLNLLSLQSASRAVSGFPNVLVSVAEMQMPSMLGSGMTSAFLANTNGVVNGIGGITILFAGLSVLYVFVKKTFKFWRSGVKSTSSNDKKLTKGKNKSSKKPPKSKRESSAKKIDDKLKFKINVGDIGFGSTDELLSSKRLTVLYTCLFVVWVVITILAVTRGSRFITTIVLPFGLLAGIFTGFAIDYIKNKLSNDKWIAALFFIFGFLAAVPVAQINMMFGILLFLAIAAFGIISVYGIKSNSATIKMPVKKYVLIVALILALLSPTVCGAFITSETVVPGTSDSMWNAMKWVGENTDEDTVITSWWDFGYLFEIAADRQVTFDGGSQSGERAFWLGQAMTTDNLELSAGIFRMLDSTGTQATAALVNYTNDTGKATDILIDILPRTSEDAKNTLMNNYSLTAEQADDVVQYTHPAEVRPVIFVASADMLQKAGWWSYFGAWDFENQSSENYNYYIPQSGSANITPGNSGKVLLFEDQGMTINAVIDRKDNNTTGYTEAVYTETGEQIYVNDTPYNPLNISNILVIEDGYIVKNESVGDVENANYTLFVMGYGNDYTPILISNELVNSMFTRLYLLGGAGQDIFENVHMENGVMLFNVNFDNTVAGGSTG